MSDIHPVRITDMPGDKGTDTTSDVSSANVDTTGKTPAIGNQTRILVSIRMTNGVQISQKNLDYRGLCRLVEKLEALC